MSGSLPGRSQTVNRAELFVFLRFLDDTQEFEKRLYIVDSSYVVNGLRRCVAGRPHSSNTDLWKLVASRVAGRDVVCLKVESHLSVAEATTQRVPAGAFLANKVADVAAGKAAEQCQLPYGEVEGARWAEALVSSVRSRCAATFISAVELDVRAPPPSPENIEQGRRVLAGRIAASQHDVVRQGPSLCCTRCRGRTSVVGSRGWLAAPCIAGDRAPEGTHGGVVRIVHKEIHQSHAHRYHGGIDLHFCVTCGAFSRSHLMRSLAQPCRGQAKRAGKCALKCIFRGPHPQQPRSRSRGQERLRGNYVCGHVIWHSEAV